MKKDSSDIGGKKPTIKPSLKPSKEITPKVNTRVKPRYEVSIEGLNKLTGRRS